MKVLKMYCPPEAELLDYASCEDLCYDDNWARSGSNGSDGYGGIELPDDIWGPGSGDGGVELPDDNIG